MKLGILILKFTYFQKQNMNLNNQPKPYKKQTLKLKLFWKENNQKLRKSDKTLGLKSPKQVGVK